MLKTTAPFLTVALLLAFLPSLTAGDWPQFRGPGGLGVSDAKDLPVRWDDETNLVWKTRLPGYGSSSPILLGDKIWVTCYSGYGDAADDGDMEDLRLHLVCVSQKNGKVLWDRALKPRLPEAKSVRDHGYAAQTPATDGEHLYVFFGQSGVVKFTLDGKQLWQTFVGSETHGWGCGTSPVLFENLVIVNAAVESGSLVAIDKKTGKEKWRAGGMKSSWNTPHLVKLKSGKTELLVNMKNTIRAFDPRTGEELWTCRGIRDYVCPSIVSQNGIAYAIGGRRSQAIAVRAGGRGDVTDTHRLWKVDVGANVSSPIIHDGHLYWVSDRVNHAYCVRMSDGHVAYDVEFPGQPYASTVLADGRLYVVTRRSGVFVLAAKPEFEQLARNRLDDGTIFDGSPAVADGRLYLRSNRSLYCIGKR